MSFQGVARWICPAGCGCEIDINASWTESPDVQGKMWRHPIPRTISSATPVTICTEHAGLESTALPADPYYDCRGYVLLNLPVILARWGVTFDAQLGQWLNANGTPSEAPLDPATLTPGMRLYIHLYRYTGTAAKLDTCDCRICECHDRAGVQAKRTLRAHPKRRKCSHHAADDDNFTSAREQNSRKNRLVDRAINFLMKQDAEFSWEYRTENGVRVLYFTILNITQQERNQAQAWADQNIGAGLVVVVRG